MKKILAIVLTTFWISISEFFRNSMLLRNHWIEHYKSLGLTFPEENINGAVWGIWSLFFAVVIFILSRKFTFFETFLLSWFIGFVLMWLVIGNLNVLPFTILSYAIPLSLVEVSIATLIIKKLSK